MKIERGQATMLAIIDAPGLDPIDVFIINYAPGKGRMIIRCWDRAWTCAWFAMSATTIEQFFVKADCDYIISNLVYGLHGLRKDAKKSDEKYLHKIVGAVQAALRGQEVALTRCAAGRDGECAHKACPQLRDNEPRMSGRHCPLDQEGSESNG